MSVNEVNGTLWKRVRKNTTFKGIIYLLSQRKVKIFRENIREVDKIKVRVFFIYSCYTNWEGHQRLHLSRASPVFPQVFVVRESLNLTTNWPVRALVGPGKIFRTIAKLLERRSDKRNSSTGSSPDGLNPGPLAC